MWGQSGWAVLCPSVPALLLLLVGTAVSTQDICSSRADGSLPAPVLYLNASSAQEGDVVQARCVLQKLVPATRIIFCKDGLKMSVLKAQEGGAINSILLNITEGSTGTYTCLYQQKNEMNRQRNSPLSPPRKLKVTGGMWHQEGHVSDPTGGTAPTETNTQQDHTVTVVASVAVTLLLSAATYWTIKEGACRERCQRHQNDPSQQMEATEYGEIQYATIAHVQGHKQKYGRS